MDAKKQTMQKITLAFDVYGTLINTSGVFDLLQELIGEKAKDFTETWRQKQLEYSFRRAAMNAFVDFSVCTQEALEYACLLYETPLSNLAKERLMQKYKVLPTFEDVAPALETLHNKKYRLFAFSNGSKEAVTQLLENAEIIQYFEGVISVEDVQVFKPSPLVYEHFLKKTKAVKANAWLISGNPFDILGAKNVGMKTAWVKRQERKVFDPWQMQPDMIIKNLEELEQIN